MLRPVRADEVGIYVDGILVACAQNVTLDINREMLEAVCSASGKWKEYTPGAIDWTASIDALFRTIPVADAATNIGPKNAFALLVDGTLAEIKFGFKDGTDPALNGFQMVGNAYVQGLSLANPVGDNQTWTTSLRGTGEIAVQAVEELPEV